MITQGQYNHLVALRINEMHSMDDESLRAMSEASAEVLIKTCTHKLTVKRRY